MSVRSEARRAVRLVSWVERRARPIVLCAAVLAVVAGYFVSHIRLDASVVRLLPSDDWSVQAFDDANRRLGNLSTMVVVIRSPDHEANLRYAAALKPRIEALGPDLVERAIYQAPEVRQFVQEHRWLYADEKLLSDVRDRLRREVLQRENPFYIDLGDEPPTFDEIEKRFESKRSSVKHVESGVFSADDVVALVVLPARDLDVARGSDSEVYRSVHRVVDEFPPSKVSPVIKLGWTGDIVTAVAEHDAIQKDVLVTSVAVVLLVALVVLLYFGRLRAVPLMGIPAMLGALVPMAFASIAFGSLNASTAFLGSIIVGNGINFPILLLARYEEERAAGRSVKRSLERATTATARPTAVAAFCAALAYASLAFTRFAGFRQFGIIGAIGMSMCWLSTFTLLPALIWIIDGRNEGKKAWKPPFRLNYGRPFAAIAAYAPALAVLVGVGLTALSLFALPRWLSDPFEYDFRNLRAVKPTGTETSHQVDEIFGRALSPSVLIANSRADAQAAKQVILDRSSQLHPSPVANVITVDDLLGGTPGEQARKIELLDEIRALLAPDKLKLLSASSRKRAIELRPPDGLRAPTVDDLPAVARHVFEERDGTVGRVVLVYPPEQGFSTWDGHDLFRLADVIGRVKLPNDGTIHAAGRPMIFAAMVRAIAHDGPLATFASFAGVSLLTFAIIRRWRDALMVIGVLTLGVLWMLGIGAALGLKLNFLNFIALPITFGIGVDYAANIALRYRETGRGSILHVLRTTGGAVMLNSATTTFGYGALLVAQNRALRSFGDLAILGEIACVSAALIFAPAIIALRDRRSAPVRAGALPQS